MSRTSPRKAPGSNNRQDDMTLREYYMAHAPITLQDAFLMCGYNDRQSLVGNDIRNEAVMCLARLRAEYADAMLARA